MNTALKLSTIALLLSTYQLAAAQNAQVMTNIASARVFPPSIQPSLGERPAKWSSSNRESLSLEEMMANENSLFHTLPSFTAAPAQKPRITTVKDQSQASRKLRAGAIERPANWSPLNRQDVTFEEIERYSF